MRFGERLKALREASRVTQAALAKRSGVSQQAISQLEHSPDTDPAWSTVCALASALHVHTDDFRADVAGSRRVKELVVRVLLGPAGGPHKEVTRVPVVLPIPG